MTAPVTFTLVDLLDREPVGVVFAAAGAKAYVLLRDGNRFDRGLVAVFDTATRRATALVRLDPDGRARPSDIIALPDADRVYVPYALDGRASVAVLDPGQDRVVSTVTVGLPDHVNVTVKAAPAPDGATLYLTCFIRVTEHDFTTLLCAVDLADGTPRWTAPVDDDVTTVAVAPDGRYVFVQSLSMGEDMMRFDTTTHAHDLVSVGAVTGRMIFVPEPRAYLFDAGSAGALASSYDPVSGNVRFLGINDGLMTPVDMVLAPGGRQLVLVQRPSKGDAALLVIDIAANTLTKLPIRWPGRPSTAAIAPTTGELYVGLRLPIPGLAFGLLVTEPLPLPAP